MPPAPVGPEPQAVGMWCYRRQQEANPHCAIKPLRTARFCAPLAARGSCASGRADVEAAEYQEPRL